MKRCSCFPFQNPSELPDVLQPNFPDLDVRKKAEEAIIRELEAYDRAMAKARTGGSDNRAAPVPSSPGQGQGKSGDHLVNAVIIEAKFVNIQKLSHCKVQVTQALF